MEWRKKVGDDEANRITERATTRGTAVHELIESHLLNKDVKYDKPGPKMLFQQSKPKLKKINIDKDLDSKLTSLTSSFSTKQTYF